MLTKTKIVLAAALISFLSVQHLGSDYGCGE